MDTHIKPSAALLNDERILEMCSEIEETDSLTEVGAYLTTVKDYELDWLHAHYHQQLGDLLADAACNRFGTIAGTIIINPESNVGFDEIVETNDVHDAIADEMECRFVTGNRRDRPVFAPGTPPKTVN